MKRTVKAISVFLLSIVIALSCAFALGCEKKATQKTGLGYTVDQGNLFGVCALPSDLFTTSADNGVTMKEICKVIKAMNIKSVRVWMHLPYVLERATRSDDVILKKIPVERYHAYFAALKEAGVKNILVMNHQYLYPVEMVKVNYNGVIPDPEEDIDAYMDFMNLFENCYRALSAEFTEITLWEPNNEMDHEKGTTVVRNGYVQGAGAANAPYLYSMEEVAGITADLCYYANRGIKSANPNNELVMPGLCFNHDSSANSMFLEVFYEQILSGNHPVSVDKDGNRILPTDTNTDNYFNVLNWHPYAGETGSGTVNAIVREPSDSWIDASVELYNVAVKNGDKGKKIFLTEFGWPDYGTESNQQKVGEYYPIAFEKLKEKLPTVEAAFVFRMFNWMTTGADVNIREKTFGLFTSPMEDGGIKPKPGAIALYKYFNGADADVSVLESLFSDGDGDGGGTSQNPPDGGDGDGTGQTTPPTGNKGEDDDENKEPDPTLEKVDPNPAKVKSYNSLQLKGINSWGAQVVFGAQKLENTWDAASVNFDIEWTDTVSGWTGIFLGCPTAKSMFSDAEYFIHIGSYADGSGEQGRGIRLCPKQPSNNAFESGSEKTQYYQSDLWEKGNVRASGKKLAVRMKFTAVTGGYKLVMLAGGTEYVFDKIPLDIEGYVGFTTYGTTTARISNFSIVYPNGKVADNFSEESLAFSDADGVKNWRAVNAERYKVAYVYESNTEKAGKLGYSVDRSNMFGICALPSDLFTSSADSGTTTELICDIVKTMNVKSVRVWMHLPYVLERSATSNTVNLKTASVAKYHAYFTALKAAGVTNIVAMNHQYIYPVECSGLTYWGVVPDPQAERTKYLAFLNMFENCYRILSAEFPEVTLWEPNNEMDHPKGTTIVKNGYVSGAGETANAAYLYSTDTVAAITADMCYYANRGIKSSNPKNELVMPALCFWGTAENSTPFLEALYRQITSGNLPTSSTEGFVSADPDDYFNVLNWHPYANTKPSQTWLEANTAMYEVAVRYGDEGKKIFLTEFGWSDMGRQDRIDSIDEWYAEAFDMLKEALPTLEAGFAFRMFDWTSAAAEVSSAEKTFGIFTSPLGSGGVAPKPAATALYRYFNGAGADISVLDKWRKS